MAKGVKKIEWNSTKKDGAGIYPKLSTPNRLLTIEPDKHAWFSVKEWYPDTTKAEKEKNITWIRQDGKEKFIIKQMVVPANNLYGFRLEKKLCGPYTYYIEASLSGKRDLKNETGLYVRGYCTPKIIDSKWCTSNDGKDERSRLFSYGEKLHLGVNTEGLNGNIVTVEIYRLREGSRLTGRKEDKRIRTIANVEVIDGEINLEINNTSLWKADIIDIEDTEKFYIKIKDAFGNYIKDDKSDSIHARFLRIKNESVPQIPKKPTNNTPVKVGESEVNKKQNELCKFSAISITETQKKDGKEEKTKIEVYDEGTVLTNAKIGTEIINQTVFFEFDQSILTTDSKKVLDNVINYLINDQSSKVTLEGYACVIGKQDYNKELSFERTAAVKKYFIDGGINQRRIICNAKGEIQFHDGIIIGGADDDKSGKDNINHKEEKNYIEARRVDISFLAYTHNADTIVYETIAPSKFKDILIEVKEFETVACHKPNNNKHKKKIKATSVEYTQKDGIEKEADNLAIPVRSALATWNVAPFQYIWPSVSTPVKYFVDIHSCRYFTDNRYNTLLIKAYPDIKWKFDLFLNLSNDLSVKWQKLPPGRDTEMKKRAGKIGAEKRWKQTEIDFGVALDANWDKKSKDEYGSHFDATAKYEAKIKQFYSVFSSLKEFSKTVTGETKGAVTKTRLGKKLPFEIYMKPPNFCLGAEWELARGKSQGKETLGIGTGVKFYFKAEPLISLGLNIDLLAGLVQAGVAVTTGGTGNVAAMQIFNEVREWLDDDDNTIKLKMYIDLEITGKINGTSELELNTKSDEKKGEGKLEFVLAAELKAGIEVKGTAVIVIGEAYVSGEASAKGTASVTFGHGIYFEKNSSKNTVYYQPKLNFDGLKVTGVLKAKVGLYIKKGIFKGDRSKNLVDYKFDKKVFEPFDVIQKFEKLSGISSKIELM